MHTNPPEPEHAHAPGTIEQHEVNVRVDQAILPGTLSLPPSASGLVLFAHGSGSSRFSPRNRYVAEVLHQAGIATLLFDLLTAEEHTIDQRTRHLRFDIGLLTYRLVGAIDWSRDESSLAPLPVGLFGASTGAAAALVAAADRAAIVGAVVSRGGRPDMAHQALARVQAPTLLIVGELDEQVIMLNRQAADAMTCPKHLEIVSGASHLFEEPGTLERVAAIARDWFRKYLAPATSRNRQ